MQLTPPGSECSIIFSTGITSAAPGSTQGLQLTVFDIEPARAEGGELLRRRTNAWTSRLSQTS